jgi:cytochrome c oxidase subunit 4
MSAVPAPHQDHHEEHHGPTVKMYWAIFVALSILTVATVVAAKIDFGTVLGNPRMGGFVNNLVALGIACTKATLVVLFFMHVKYENKLVGLAAVSSVIWLLFLVLITASDYLSRTSYWHLFG